MAARKATKPDAGDDVLDVPEAGLSDDDELLAGDEDVDLDDAFDDEEPDLDDAVDLDDDLDDDADAADEDGIQETALEDADLDGDDDGEDTIVAAPLPPEAEFDDDEDDIVAAVAGDDDADDDGTEVDGLRDGEFVCRSCFMAKRETQLADPERLLCRDCA